MMKSVRLRSCFIGCGGMASLISFLLFWGSGLLILGDVIDTVGIEVGPNLID